MSSDSETITDEALPKEDGPDSTTAPAKKAAKKAAKKTARKAARKTTAIEAASGPASDSEFRPADFKGRGSHAEAAEAVAVAPDAPKVAAGKSPKPVSGEAKADEASEAKSSGAEESSKVDQPKQGGGGGQGGHQGGKGRQHQGHGQQGKKKGKGQQQQKGGRRGKQQGKQGKGRGHPGGGWHQPPPPSEHDFVEGELPAAARFSKKEACDTLLEGIDTAEPIDLTVLYELKLDPLVAELKAIGANFEEKPGRKQAIESLFKLARESKKAFKDVGFLDIADQGHGFIVHVASNYQLKPESVFIPSALISEYGLKRGHLLEVVAIAPEEGERCPAAIKIVSAMGQAPEEMAKVTPFEDLIPYYPTERLVLETPMPSNNKKDVSMRAFDLLTPIGFGQRGLIVAPPRTGKTVLLQGLANSIQTNWPDVHLIVLLIDERPEEVTDFKRMVDAEIVSSTFDEVATSHVHAAEMVIEKARRMVEKGEKVAILLDSITRLARAYNTLASNSGKIMSGGIEATALQKPKRFFGSARNIEEGGSLTIMGTALVDTGSKMDEVIFEEFKGTGNMELHLDRDLINKRIFPAMNFERSGTRKEELLYHPQELEKVYGLRRVMQGVPGMEAMEMLIKRLKVTKNNVEFLMSLK